MKLLLIKESLKIKAGGAEKVFTLLANQLNKLSNIEVSLLTFDYENGESFYNIDKSIPWFYINDTTISPFIKKYVPGNFFKKMFTSRNILKPLHFDQIIVFGDFMNIFSIVLAKSLSIPIIISDRNNPKLKKLSPKWELLKKVTYPLANKLVVMTEGQKRCYSNQMKKKIHIIPNPIVRNENNETNSFLIDKKPYILAIGKLMPQKGLNILIKAFSELSSYNHLWKLIILGEGPDRNKLKKLIEKLNLEDSVFLPGIIKEVPYAIKQSEFFVLPSRFEGFPNALLEAMSYGKAVISTKCDFGPEEIVINKKNGYLIEVDNIKSLKTSIELLIEDKSKRIEMGKQAVFVTETFNIDKIVEKWIDLISLTSDKK